MGLKEALDGSDGGLRRQWEEHKVGIGGRVRSLVLERLRMNERAGIVGKWQEVCYTILPGSLFGREMLMAIHKGSRDHGTASLRPRVAKGACKPRR